MTDASSNPQERPANPLERLPMPERFRQDFTALVQAAGGAVWTRPGLSPAKRSLATIAMLTALVRPDELRIHIGMGLDNGLTPDEIGELLMHCAVYGGFPAAVNAMGVCAEVFAERGIE